MRQPEIITSPANPLLKDIRKAVNRGGLTDSGCCVAETFHLLEEALRSNCRVRTVIAGESIRNAVEDVVRRPGIRIVVVPDKLLDPASQGVVALVDPPEWRVEQMFHTPQLVLVVDGLQDPGNLGTVLRSAEAFGAGGLLLLKGTVNPFNPKVARASSGSIFRVPFISGWDRAEAVATLSGRGIRIYAAVPNAWNLLPDADLRAPCAIVVGSEGRGVSDALRSAATDLTIPTTGVESLNAAISAAILLYEARRQRSSTL